MKINFDSNQQYQLDAIQSVVDVFEGQPLNKGDFEVSFAMDGASIAFTESGVGNNLVLSEEQILKNIQTVQERNSIKVSDKVDKVHFLNAEEQAVTASFPNITVEMETGTGKTYVYLRTIYELNQVYGFKKFVIVVPGVPIREGTLKNLQITHDHFQSLYNAPPINFLVYDSGKLSGLRNYATANSIQILVINIQSFIKDDNIINQVRETGVKPIEYIQGTRPIVILDEPQNMETDKSKAAIANLNPLCTLRYSATHRNFYNLIYQLNPVQAYDLGLVKQIEVDGIVAEDNQSAAYIKFEGLKRLKNDVRAKLKIFVNDKGGVKAKTVTCSVGADLYKLSNNRDIYQDGFIINSISAEWGEIEFANGTLLTEGQEQGGLNDEVLKFQIDRTIKKHMEKARRYEPRGIKVLSLFFIDKVANYREYLSDGAVRPGKFAEWFEEIYARYAAMPQYANLYKHTPEELHNGYFSQDSKGKLKDTTGKTKADGDTYTLIMKDKERLLSQEEPLRFIFSHSALREGWDNPNVFQLCTLREMGKEIERRQTIGRGLRLPVSKDGNRVFDRKINILTVVANETYSDYAAALQADIERDTSVKFENRIKNARDKAQIKLSKELTRESCPEFFEIWDKIKFKTRYQVEYDSAKLIEKSVEEVKKMPETKRPMMSSQTARIGFGTSGIETKMIARENRTADQVRYPIPDVYGYIQSKTNLSKRTIFEILKCSGRIEELELNPQLFLDNVIGCMQRTLNRLLVDGIKYQKIEDQEYAMRLFENEEIETYLSNLFEVNNTDKTLYNYVPVESDPERSFARDCEVDENVKFYFKLPRGFKISTPIGGYNPDWAVIFENDKRIYFVAETKSSIDSSKRRVEENLKILYGEKHFALFEKDGVTYKVVDGIRGLY